MKAKKIIVIVVATLTLGGGILAFCLTRGDTAPDTPPEPTETENTEPTITDLIISPIEDEKHSQDVHPSVAEVVINVSDYDNGHRDTPSVSGDVYINPGRKEDNE